MTDDYQLLIAQIRRLADQESDPQKEIRLRAAICVIVGDDNGYRQHMAAAAIPAAEWEALAAGKLEY